MLLPSWMSWQSGPQSRCLGPVCLATHHSHTLGPHRSTAIWLLPWPGSRPRACDATSTVQGDGQSGDLLVHGEGLSVRGEHPGI